MFGWLPLWDTTLLRTPIMLHAHTFAVLWGLHLGLALLGQVVTLRFPFWGTARLSPRRPQHGPSPRAVNLGEDSSTSTPTLALTCLRDGVLKDEQEWDGHTQVGRPDCGARRDRGAGGLWGGTGRLRVLQRLVGGRGLPIHRAPSSLQSPWTPGSFWPGYKPSLTVTGKSPSPGSPRWKHLVAPPRKGDRAS